MSLVSTSSVLTGFEKSPLIIRGPRFLSCLLSAALRMKASSIKSPFTPALRPILQRLGDGAPLQAGEVVDEHLQRRARARRPAMNLIRKQAAEHVLHHAVRPLLPADQEKAHPVFYVFTVAAHARLHEIETRAQRKGAPSRACLLGPRWWCR